MNVPRLYWSGVLPAEGRVEITGDDAHRLRHVLRLRTGDAIALFDGRGHEWVGAVAGVTKQAVVLAGLEQIEPVAEARVPVSLAFGVLKGDQMDAVVRDATMLGVVELVPLRSSRVTVTPKAWMSGAARDRWQRVAIASATQCRRAVVPEVRAVADFEVILREPAPMRLICVEPAIAAETHNWKGGPVPSSVQLLVGPEGGWSAGEVQLAVAAGALTVSLGPRTLRAETAPVVALTMMSTVWGW